MLAINRMNTIFPVDIPPAKPGPHSLAYSASLFFLSAVALISASLAYGESSGPQPISFS